MSGKLSVENVGRCLLLFVYLFGSSPYYLGVRVNCEPSFCKPSEQTIVFDDDVVVGETKTAESSSAVQEQTSPRDFRLPSTLVPINYRVFTRPVLDEPDADLDDATRFTSPSHIWIQVECLQNTSQIVLHAKNLTVHQKLTTVYKWNTSEAVIVRNQTFDVLNEFLILHLNSSLEAGNNYEIFLDFIAPVYRNRRDGIYLTEYTDPADSKNSKFIVSTLFAPTQGRRAFPCFDEPQLKATFTMNIGRTDNYTTLCNMELISSTAIAELDGWYYDEYNTTVPMSTYLVAFMISNFSNDTLPANEGSSVEGAGKPFLRTWADSNHVEKGGLAYATNTTSKLLPFFEEYLHSNFSLSKLDSVAMPKIAYAGMESWGLIIYMESTLLHFPSKSTEQHRKRTTGLISHELAHQWFGNLVTFSWWSDIWLSEGLATYMQFVGVDHVFPEFDSWSHFVSDVFHSALTADSFAASSHPLHFVVDKNQAIFSIYDKIAYDKGASIVRMTEHFLSKPVLQASLQNYVNKFAYKGVHQDQFFDTLNTEAVKAGALPPNVTVKDVLDTWTLQAGYPLLRVSHISEENRILFEQERYDPEGLGHTGSWWIPITIDFEGESNFGDTFPDLWLAKDQPEKSMNVTLQDEEWAIVNAGSTGFYRVLYDTNLTEAIQRQLYLNHTYLPSSARCRLIDDYFTVAAKRYTTVETALNMISYLGKETDFSVWKTVFSHLKYISEMLSNEDSHLSAWLNTKFKTVFAKIDEESSPEEQEAAGGAVQLRRHYLLTWACHFKMPRCLDYATTLMGKWMEDTSVNPIPQGIKPIMYCAIASGIDAELSDFLLTRYSQETDQEEKMLLIEGLSCGRDMNMVQTELTKMGKSILGNSTAFNIPDQEQMLKAWLNGAIKSSSEGRDVSWKFIQTFFNDTVETHKLNRTTVLGDAVLMLGNYWNTPKDRQDLENFVNLVGVKYSEDSLSPALRSSISRSFQTSLDRVDNNIDWMSNFYSRVQSWFALENYYFPDGFLN